MPTVHDLTPSQRKAVEHQDGPLLVLAGPGSGKTRVITRRIVRLVDRDVDPRRILAITFTNKAATEMANRVTELMPGCRVWVSTFHRFCAHVLRRRAELVGLRSNFSIFDTTDQQQLIRHVLNELDFDPVSYPPSKIAARISRAKNDLVSAEDFARHYDESIGDHFQAVIARVYPEYQRGLLQSNAVDFDDLLLHMVALLSENPELRSELDERYQYILVDEYQDTNLAQYRIVAGLSRDYQNLCVTGDPDQSIYGWRGAKIDNILRFESDYPDAVVVRLEENFRSTQRILQAADELIARNVYRKAKSLITSNPEGEPVELLGFRDGKHEADAIAREMRQAVDSGERVWSDFAVFYRVNSLSREIELALSRYRIPFQIVAGVAFYERTEVKDLLGYLRLVQNPDDRTAFLRVVNTPLRGIGKVTQSKLSRWAEKERLSLLEAAARATEAPKLSKRAGLALQSFAKLMNEFSLADAGSVEKLLERIIERTGYTRGWGDNPTEEDLERIANVNEFLTAARQYDRRSEGEGTLEGFLEATSLAAESDHFDESAGKVTLMTLHSAKGLEFPVVYLLAVEQGLIPHERALQSSDLHEFEEERRLLFVGMTRAMQRLYLTQTVQRELRGRPLFTISSEFLAEMQLVHRDRTSEESQPESFLIETEHRDDNSQTESSPSRRRRSRESRPLLTTGAALLNGNAEPATLPQGFAVGMEVRHPRYGLGTIVNVSGFAKNRTLTVEFHEGDRTETFVAAKCPLQPVGMR